MEISPYDNFDNWSCILLSTLQCSQDYIYLIPDCIDLMFSIISENQLPEPITFYTEKFLNSVIPDAINALLKISTTNADDIETCIGFLSTALTLCTWGVQNNIESLFNLPPLILNQYQYFYHENNESWKTIIDNFLSSGDMNLICELMISDNPFPPLKVYLYVLEIILVFFKNKLFNDVTAYLDQFIVAFGNYLRSLMDLQKIRNINKDDIHAILCDLYRILSNKSFDHIYDLSTYYEFFEFCFKSEIIFIQLFISKNFRYFLMNATDEMIIQFNEWCESKKFIQFLISKDFNEEVIKQIVYIFDSLADKNMLNKSILYALWNRTLNVHTSLKGSYIKLISRILYNMKSNDAKKCLTKILLNGNNEIDEADMENDENDDDDEAKSNIELSQESSSANEIIKGSADDNMKVTPIEFVPINIKKAKNDENSNTANEIPASSEQNTQDDHEMSIKDHSDTNSSSNNNKDNNIDNNNNNNDNNDNNNNDNNNNNNDNNDNNNNDNNNNNNDNNNNNNDNNNNNNNNDNNNNNNNNDNNDNNNNDNNNNNNDNNNNNNDNNNNNNNNDNNNDNNDNNNNDNNNNNNNNNDNNDNNNNGSINGQINNSINNRSKSDEAYASELNKDNYRCNDLSIKRYNEICSMLSSINLDFQLTNELLQLLIIILSFCRTGVSYYILTILYEFSKKDDRIAQEFIKSIAKRWSYKSRLFLFYKCFDSIQGDEVEHHLVSEVLPKLIRTVEYNVDLGREFENRLFESLPYDRPLIYSIISQYYQGNMKLLPLRKIISIYGGYNGLDDEFWSFMQSLLDTNGVLATTDEGFEQLKECIDQFDFKKATPKFVYFLKSYYLVINLYEGRMKTEDFYKQIVRGPIKFIKSNSPPIGLDSFFKILELTEDEHVASITIHTILIFSTSYEGFNCDDSIGIIKDIILPKIESKDSTPILIKRYLKVLYDISHCSELNVYLVDYNYPKHSIYAKNIVLFDVAGVGIHQFMICDAKDTFVDVQKRLHDAYPFLRKEHLYFHINGSFVDDENSFIDSFNIDKKVQKLEISVFNSEDFERNKVDTNKNFVLYCPSLFLTEQHFQSLLLSFYNEPELIDIVNQLLNFLPNDPDDIKLDENIESFISILLDNDNIHLIQYHLQILIYILKVKRNDDSIINQFKNVDFCNILCQFLKNHIECSYEIISIFLCLFSKELEPIVGELILIVCNVLASEKIELIEHVLFETKNIAAQLFHDILTNFPDLNVFVDNPDMLESIVSQATPDTWPLIRIGLFNLTNILPLFDKLLDDIEQVSSSSTSSINNSRYFAELFTAYVPRVSNECNVSKILDMCVDLLTSQNIYDKSNDDSQSIISLCQMISSILDSNKQIEDISDLSIIISKTLPVALETDDTSKQKAIYDLCLSLAGHIPDGQNQINQIMKSVYEIETDRWNYKPENFTKSSTGFVGLTNLGATCYMNSVLQQLFYCRQFRDSVFTEDFESKPEEKEAFLEFKKIFAHLLLSKKQFADTRPFCNIWKAWERRPINVREQQDASDFLNMFLDQLPESLHKLYKGTIINKIEGNSEEYYSSNIEDFYAFSLEIKNFSKMEESFENFLQEELFTGENQIIADESTGHKIDARKYSRIQKAPPVLILQLKRFSYNIRTFVRDKIYSRFEIPQTINIEKLLEKSEEMIYELKGVVVHFGNANGGHYTSIIKIDGDFYDFNDMNVSNFNECNFEEETFGGNQMSNCAYLLFYERKETKSAEKDAEPQQTNSVKEIDVDAESNLIPADIKEEIEKENKEFIQCQIAFTHPTLHFASYCNDVQLMTDYYLNIFLHSALSDESHIIVERLKNCLVSNFKEKWFINHLIEIFSPKMEEFFSNCSNEDISCTFNDIIYTIIDSSEIKLFYSNKKLVLNNNSNNDDEENNAKQPTAETENQAKDDDDEENKSENEEENNAKQPTAETENQAKDDDDGDDGDGKIKEAEFLVDSEMLLSLLKFTNLLIQYSSTVKQWRQYKHIFSIPYYFLNRCNINILMPNVYHKNEDMTPNADNSTIIIHDEFDQTVDLSNQIDVSSWPKIITDIIINFYKDTNSEVVLETVDFSRALKILQRTWPIGEESPIMDYYSKIILSKSNIISFFSFALKTKQTKFDVESGFTYFYNDSFTSSENKYLVQYAKNVLTLTDFNAKFYLFDQEQHFISFSDILTMLSKQVNEKNNRKLRSKLINNYNNYIIPFLTNDSNSFTRDSAATLTLDLFPTLISIDEIYTSYKNLNKRKNDKLTNLTQLEELKNIWRQCFEQIILIANDPKSFIADYEQGKNFKQNDYRFLQLFYVLKWIKNFIELKNRAEFDTFMVLFNSLVSLGISNNINLPILADIIISYPTEYWFDEAAYIVKESIIYLNVDINNQNIQRYIDVIDQMPHEKVDEIFNDDKCLQIAADFFKIQICISKYNIFDLISRYLERNPAKASIFYDIFDENQFDPEKFHKNMICILNVPSLNLPCDVSFCLLSNIIKYLIQPQITSFEREITLDIFPSLQRHILIDENRFKTDFDFDIISIDNLRYLVTTMKDYYYTKTVLDDFIIFLCIDQNTRKNLFEIIHPLLSEKSDYLSNFDHLLDFYLSVIHKYSVDEELSNETKFIVEKMILSIEHKNGNNFLNKIVYDFIINTENKEAMKVLSCSLLRNINFECVYDKYIEPFFVDVVKLIGLDDIKPIVKDLCDFICKDKDANSNEDVPEIYLYNLAIVIEIFPEILDLIKDEHPSMMPLHSFGFRIKNAFYPST